MSSRPAVVLSAALKLLRPLVRLLLRHGIGFPALVAALKPVFVDEARAELVRRDMAVTDSALTLLSGVHRRDVRRLKTETARPATESGLASGAVGPVAELIGRWLTDPSYQRPDGQPRPLPRAGDDSFDALAASISNDVRPRALLDEMLRLGVVEVADDAVTLAAQGFAPRQGFEELSALFSANLHDHVAASVANLEGDANFLEQALFVDELTQASAQALQQAARQAWQRALQQLMPLARERFDDDAVHAAAAERTHRVRFGVYCFHAEEPLP